MGDRPSIEQQLAAIIAKALDYGPIASLPAAAAIVAAVNEGRCPPIVPERKPNLIRDAVLDVLRDELADKDAELAELRALKAKVDLLQRHPDDDAYVYRTDEWGWLVDSAGMLLTWLREANDE